MNISKGAKKKHRVSHLKVKEALGRSFSNRSHPTLAEVRFAEYLGVLGVCFIPEYVGFYDKGKYRLIDFYVQDHKLGFEIDGGYHDSARIKAYDSRKDFGFTDKIIRYRNEEVFEAGFIERLKTDLILRFVAIYGKYGIKHQGFKDKLIEKAVQPVSGRQ